MTTSLRIGSCVKKTVLAVAAFLALVWSAAPATAASNNALLQQCEPQKQSQWCWAACVASCLKYSGMQVTQEQLVVERFGAVVNRSLPSVVLVAQHLNRSFSTHTGNVIVSPQVVDGPLDLVTMRQLIDAGCPIIACIGEGNPWSVPAHAIIFYGYHVDWSGNTIIHIFDPFPPHHLRVIPYNQAFAWEQTIIVKIHRAG